MKILDSIKINKRIDDIFSTLKYRDEKHKDDMQYFRDQVLRDIDAKIESEDFLDKLIERINKKQLK